MEEMNGIKLFGGKIDNKTISTISVVLGLAFTSFAVVHYYHAIKFTKLQIKKLQDEQVK